MAKVKEIIEKLVASGQLRQLSADYNNVYKIKNDQKVNLFLDPSDIEEMIIEALQDEDQKSEMQKEVKEFLYSETDGSCDIYYMQYQRSMEYKATANITLRLDTRPRFIVALTNERKEWGDWY